MSHRMQIRVYYEDTDFGGVVYYANYLRFIERARSEWVRELGIDQVAMKEVHGLVFVVRRVVADYLAPGRYDDLLVVETIPKEIGRAKFVVGQVVRRGEERLFEAEVTIAVLSAEGRPARIPAEIRQALSQDAG
ncbi:tol-pal system-associated acyl-CoA thioesterase [Aestuariibius sp. 2305UL40-4]|uniref:tol-pal system-associated acyl-CoA thioesterase n=1 Tax=Aestuariibius violaceus TaxID=3234132 RepID=UPI00345E24C4